MSVPPNQQVQPNQPAQPAGPAPASASAAVAKPADGVTVTIDGFEITVPKGTLVIRAAEQLGIQIPRFCDHPLLDPIGACRQCLVAIDGQPKPLDAPGWGDRRQSLQGHPHQERHRT